MFGTGNASHCRIGLLVAVGAAVGAGRAAPSDGSPERSDSAFAKRFVSKYCIDCHHRDDRNTPLALDGVMTDSIAAHPKIWEKVARKLGARQMPPPDQPRPDEPSYVAFVAALEAELDGLAAKHPDPGRTPTLRRLNRTEYRNAVRDLLALDVDAAALLPPDEPNRGFDSAPLGGLSPTLLERYISAAQKIARMAVGKPPTAPNSDAFRVPADVTQEGRVEGLPLGTRGGIRIPYVFPQTGAYDVQVWLTRDRNEIVEGLHEPHETIVLLDRRQVASLIVKPSPDGEVAEKVDAKLKARITATAGPHELGVTFLQNGASLLETKRQPYQARFNLHRHPRTSPAVFQVSVTGPFDGVGPSETPSRRRLFVRAPTGPADEDACAKAILAPLIRRAYRRPVGDGDLEKPLSVYRQARAAKADFEAGVEAAVGAVLVNPQFLHRLERDPPGLASNTAYRVNDLDLASRLSFFLWSTIPDDELLDLAERGRLSDPETFEKQVRRSLADDRARNLATNFAVQWLHLRNLDAITPDLRLFPDFDDNLRKSMRRETELFVEGVLREDRSVLELLRADYTFLDERLAKHYGVPHVYGERFRRVNLGADRERGGLLRHGGILTVTSYATRTSPVIRGKWILENLLGTPPPPPPGNVGSLDDNVVAANLPIRERLAAHRTDAACASCHRTIDPVGFALEHFDAVGRRRLTDAGRTLDAAGGLPDGSTFDGVAGLEQALLRRPELFVRTLTEKLFVFALGRAPEEADAPAIRKIVRDARAQGYRFSSIVLGLANSTPFRMRKTP
jgi:hypothetical protein